ncbi:class I SAM-dependent methyltransferase [Chloroflexota bacterium]
MKIRVEENWWQDLFDEIYLLTDARSVCNEELTCREVDFIVKTFGTDKTSPILDLCGGHGRHSLELSRRGFQNVTVLDYSEYLISLGKQKAGEENSNTRFIRGDARGTGLPAQSYGFVMIMASSFGYFIDENENRKILSEAYRLLMPGGIFFLDLPDRDFVLQNFKPFASREVNKDITVTRERELRDNIIYSREKVLSKKDGCIRDRTYCTRLYTPEKITELMHSAGFSSVSCRSNFMNRSEQGDFGCMTNRIIIRAKRD